MAPKAWVLSALVLLVICTPVLRATENEIPEAVHQLTASVNTRRLANVVGDEFVSFSTKPQDIFDGQGNPICETSFLMAQSLGRTYLKVVADSSQLHLQTTGGQSVIGGPDDAGLVQIKASAWQAFYEWANRAGVVPVFVLDYPTDGGLWDAKKALQVLSAASGLGIEECRWQLGNGNVLDGSKYGEDLKTFRTMLKAFPKQRWGVVACELKPNGAVPLEEIQYFHANIDTLVDAVTISRPLYGESAWNSSSLQREAHLRGLYRQRLPLWLDLVDQRDEEPQPKTSCDDRCLKEGLEYARTLGEAARGGVSTVFKPVHRGSIQQYTLDYLTALLYKRTVGNKVFSVQQQQQPDASRTSVYAYCTRNVSGSVTLVVVNEEETDAINATIRLTTRALSSPVELFLVGVQNGQPTVNNRAFTDGSTVPELVPVTAVTTLSNGVSFYVPAQTILFATVPGVQVRECRNMHLPAWRKPALPRELINDPTSTDVLLQELIGALLEQAPLEPLQRKRRSVATEKRKRFLARFPGAAQDGDLAESLAQALSGAQPEPAPTERSARGPRQTQAYKRQQRRVRQKEKRVEKRNLRKMKHPLRESQRERSKRGGHQLLMHRAASKHPNHRVHQRLLKRMSAKLASRKTKRSSLAEAVNEPPSFMTSNEDEEQQGGRSDFPLGDVHLVISKTAGGTDGGPDYVSLDSEESVEYRKPDRRTPRYRPGVRRRVTISHRDFHRFGLARERMPVDSEEEVNCKYHRGAPRRKEQDMETKETKRVDRYIPIEIERVDQRQENSDEDTTMSPGHEDSREGFTIAQSTNEKEADDADEELTEGSSPSGPSEDQEPDDFDEPEPNRAESEEVQLFTPAPRTSEERQIKPWLDNPPQWSLESTSAEVAEVLHRRYKRSGQALDSVESHEVERLEDFFRTNAKLQQKFAEMFDLLLEAIEELEDSEENDAKEDTDDDDDGDEASENDAHRRTKRNALLHPQSWESRERSNMIQRQQESSESKESQIIPVVRNERADPEPTGTEPVDDHPDGPVVDSDDGKPGAYVLRSVVNFMRRATSEFHQLFSGWFKKTS
ncbi:AGAP012974-PA-like protein [Anopheles sinensis]|uniref:AGAP012974-PA-like protein n=1 Tax=Anopheles sinensis TaxID=74873 RepID=A0A084W1Q7_ANOSI|nr:AGAP012974-PA-like protein [Anopheles sinensis]